MKKQLRNIAATLALGLLTVLQTTAQDIPTWTDITPAAWSGNFERVAFSKGARALAAADNGWIYQSLDTGRTWSNIYNGFANKKGYFWNGDTYNKLLVNSVPALDFFTDSLHGIFIGVLNVFPLDTTVIAYTSNGGQTWQNSQTIFNNCTAISNLYWKSKDTALVSIFNESTFETYIYMSANSGMSWTRTIGKLSTVGSSSQICFITPSHGYAYSTGYYGETTDGGKTWTPVLYNANTLFSGITFSNGHTLLNFNTVPNTTFPKCTFNKQQVVQIADLGNGKVFGVEGAWTTSTDYVIDNSTDSGKTWTQQTLSLSTCGFISLNGIAKLNSKVLIAVSGDLTSIVSKDGGVTWNKYVYGAGDGFNTVYAKSTNEVYITGSTGRLFHTVNGGATWDYRDFSTTLNQIVFPTNDTGYISSYGKLYRTIDAGNTWTNYKLDYCGKMLSFPTKDIGFSGFDATGDFEGTTDAGQTWTWLGDMTFYTYVTKSPTDGLFISPTEGLISGDNSLLYTNDGGNTFQNEATGITGHIIYENGNWLIFGSSKIYLCDKDFNCKTIHSYPNLQIYSQPPRFRDANTLYIMGDSLLISRDGGNSWKSFHDTTFGGMFGFGDSNTVYDFWNNKIKKGLFNTPITSSTTLSNFNKTGSSVSFVLTNTTNSSFAATIEVLNGSNAVVSQTTATITSGATETVNLSALPAGTYTIEVVPNDKTIGTAQSQSFTLGTSAVGIVETAAKSYRLVGNTLVFSNTQCAVYSMLGVRLSPQGSMSVTLPAGVYVVQTPQGTDKVVVTR